MIESKRERYLYGGCYLLALAIHTRTGWEIVSAWVESAKTSFGEEHAMVRLPDGRLLDAAGLHEPGSYPVSDELPDEYQASDTWRWRHVTPEILADADELLREVTSSISPVSEGPGDHDSGPVTRQTPCARGESPLTYMPAITGELVLGGSQ